MDLEEAEKGSVKLTELKKNKHMITQALLEKIEANLGIIDQILNLFHIVNPKNKNLKDQSLISQQERATIIDSIKNLDLEAQSLQSKLKHSIFKYKNIQVCKKCYNIMTYIHGMLEKKLNDQLDKIRRSKTEKAINERYN